MSPSHDGQPRDAGDAIARFVEVCAADERIVASFLGGSCARGEADGFSDIDLCVVVADDDYDDLIARRSAFVRRLGEPLFLEDFGHEHMAFAILADGTELELHLVRAGDLRSIRPGPHRVLFDPDGMLADIEFAPPEVDPTAQVEQLGQILSWFWHDVAHFTTALGRGQLWWAAGQLEQLRGCCVNLIRIEQGGAMEDEPYWKLDEEISTDALAPLDRTFVAMERGALLDAGRETVAFFRERAPRVAGTFGLTYPEELAQMVGGHLDDLGTQ